MPENGERTLQLPVSCLAEYVTKGGRSPESVLRPYKFRTRGEGRARIIFHPAVLNAIRRYFKLNKDPGILEAAIVDWHKKANTTAKKCVRARHISNISALNLFRLHYADMDFEILSVRRITCRIEQLVITAQPDLWVKRNGREHLIKIGFGSPHLWTTTIKQDVPKLRDHIKAAWDKLLELLVIVLSQNARILSILGNLLPPLQFVFSAI